MKLKTRSPRSAVFSLVLAMGFAVSAAPAGAQHPAETSGPDATLDVVTRLQDAFAGVAKRVFPSVVRVTSYVRERGVASDPRGGAEPRAEWREARDETPYPGFRELHAGSGVVVSEEGQVITLRQFVTTADGDPADVVDVETHDARHILSRIVGLEPTLNLAVLEFVALPARSPPKFEPATLGDSDSMRVGYWAIALGDPSGPEKTFSSGVLSALPERRCYQDDMSATYMLVSAPKLHPESYGGPLVNIYGEVVGITTPRLRAGTTYSGFEYALPINIVLPVYNGITVERSSRSPWLGISVLEMMALRERDPDKFDSMMRPRIGVYIDNVFDPSPATRAGIRVGDFLVKLNDKRISSVFRFQEQLYLAGIGRRATLEIFRDGETLNLEVTVDERPAAAAPR